MLGERGKVLVEGGGTDAAYEAQLGEDDRRPLCSSPADMVPSSTGQPGEGYPIFASGLGIVAIDVGATEAIRVAADIRSEGYDAHKHYQHEDVRRRRWPETRLLRRRFHRPLADARHAGLAPRSHGERAQMVRLGAAARAPLSRRAPRSARARQLSCSDAGATILARPSRR